MTSIDDVAKLAGVSTATVSRVINNKGKYSEKTKLKVLKAVEELNYKPSTQARHLAKFRKGFNICVLYSERIKKHLISEKNEFIQKSFYSIVLKGIADGAQENKVKMDTLTFNEFIKKNTKYDGILILGSDKIPNNILECNIPIVFIDNYIVGKKTNSIVSNGFDGTYYTIDKMIKRGYKKIFHIHGSLMFYGFRRRFEGYELAMKNNNLFPITYEIKEEEESINYVMSMIMPKKPEIIFASNDSIAIMILKYLKNNNIKVPDEVQLIGFDDVIDATLVNPPLSTIKVFKYEMGNVALERLIELINGKNLHPYVTSLFTEFIERKTTKGV
ncbi:transcriptional regulator, LacI family [Marinitoga hydrogenitolerans DSM 16785]|uniref:Transcriptional regulator, LacI family n=1 Tax=Marinitoga hydrogenitolerans (strain DSM 16785 / JCM 12826 / AT1271) TaxID=1122195 RepID=A0A1M4SJ80_MARH1|nr:LacI family DNA-binding transcriptional regulator [Marinitoga hydrogenitolerans]SHE32208.1 transcriptional regulator, LacI family [Marinitoga hydrogenitolerans DSM 16785]